MKTRLLPIFFTLWLIAVMLSAQAQTKATVTDIDGNVYPVITIGDQTWLGKNLQVSKYNNGDAIDNVTDADTWTSLTTGAWVNFDNNADNDAVYGKLYNYFTVADERGLCPEGWHVPNETEWSTLMTFLGGSSVAGGKLKAAGTDHWSTPNTGASDEVNFTALPTGYRSYISDGPFYSQKTVTYYWSADEEYFYNSYRHGLSYDGTILSTYSDDKNFGYAVRCIQDAETSATLPTVTTTAISAIAQTTATSGGNVSSDGGAEVTVRGICWNTAANPTTDNSKTSDGTGIGEFTSSLSGLTANTTYYVRAYATNSEGTAYGNEINFTTLQEVSTQEYASLPFNENFDGTWIDKDDTRDVPSIYWKNTPATGNNSWRRFDDGVASGAWSFDSGAYSPSGAKSTANSARFHTFNSSNGQVGVLELYVDFSSLAGEKELSFSYINPSGNDWLTIYVSTDGGNNYGTGIFHQTEAIDWEAKTISLGDLTSTQGVIKFETVSDYGVDDIGLDEISITSATSSGTIADIDGNLYDTVRIGNQTWFAQELKTSKYRNGDEIPGAFNSTDWTQTTGAQAVYGNEDGAFFEYGRLYNHYAVTDPRGLCPDGWRVPADADWDELINYLGGSSVAGGKMKEIGTVHWNSPNTGATNESGFNGLPGGMRGESGTYDFVNVFGLYWSYTEYSSSNGNSYYLWYNSSTLSTYDYGKSSGLSVRCIKGDNLQAQLPTVSTTTISGITKTTATSGGNVSSDGGAEVTARGICWSTATNPTIADSKTSDDTGIGSFTSSLSSLTANTTYYVRAYATNSEGTAYGNELSFTTLALTPPVAAFSADVTAGSAPLNVQFTDASSGNPTSWSWDFNNDGTEDATTQNPSFTYTNAGTYSVKLTVTNADGSDVELKTDYIVVNEATGCLSPDNYTMNFETSEDLSAWSYLDANNDGDYWGISSDKGIDGTACAMYNFNDVNAANDWLFTPCFDMEAGKKYRISFSYAVAGSSFPEKLALGFGLSADESMNIVHDLGAITNTDYTSTSYDVTISSSGSYHFGWKCYSEADMWNVYFDGVSISVVTESDFAGGSGTEANPWQIATVEHLVNVKKYLGNTHNDKYFIQTANINLNVAPWNAGEGWEPIGSGYGNYFHGHYNGDGFTISGLYANRPNVDNQGLFGMIENAEIKNMVLTGAQITGNSYIGALVGWSSGASITDCQVSSVVTASGEYMANVGGLAGYNYQTTMTNCSADATVSGAYYVGGLVGNNNESTYTHCFSAGTVNCTTEEGGGLIGRNYTDSAIDQCYSTANVSGKQKLGGFIGGNASSDISNSYATGIVTSSNGVSSFGGFVGYNDNTSVIENCYSIGEVNSSTYASGGFAGTNFATITNCFWNTQTSGKTESNGGTGLTTAEMLTNTLFTSWNFTTIWDQLSNETYPFLRFQNGAKSHNYPEADGLSANFTADITEGTAPLTVTFTDLSTGNPTAWAWDFNNDGTFDSYEQNPTYTYTTPGTFSVKLVAATSTQENGITFSDYISVNPVGINDAVNNALFSFYPNPSNGMVYLKLTEYSGALNIEVMDLAGKTVIKQSENYLAEAIIPIDLKAANTGIYVIKVSTDRGVSMKKLIIE